MSKYDVQTGFYFKKLKKSNNKWIEELSEEVYCIDTEACDVEWVKILDKYYLFFNDLSAGSSLGKVRLALVSLEQNKIYIANIFGPNGRYDEVSYPQPLSPEFVSFFEARINTAENVYHPKADDSNMESAKNAVWKWQDLNPSIQEKIRDGIKSTKVSIPMYSKSLFSAVTQDSPEWSHTDFENDTYKIQSYFKGPVLVFNKKSQKYFVGWVPGWEYDWVQEISFTNSDTIKFHDSFSDKYIYINFSGGTLSVN